MNIDLIELADQLTTEEIAELLARHLCLDVQAYAKDMVDQSEDDPEEKQSFETILSDPNAMIKEAKNMAFEGWFQHHDLSYMIDKALEDVAEEYVR